MNLMEVHSPYDPPRPFYPYPFWRRQRTFHLTGGGKGMRPFLAYNLGVEQPPEDFVRMVRTLYMSAARYEDWILGRTVRMIEDRGRPTVMVVVSDHGENLGDHGLFGHNSSLAQTLLHVPLVVWGYKVDIGSGVVSGPASLLGLPDWLRAVADGSVQPLAPSDTVVSEYESTSRWVPEHVKELQSREGARVPELMYNPGLAVRRGSLKYLWVTNGREAVFDLAADPGEEHELAASRPDDLERFRAERVLWEKRRVEQPAYGAGEEAEQEIADHLRELGYVE
jgi:arylsulfatase A-like enzyme